MFSKPEGSDEVDGGQRPTGEEDDDGGADGLGEEGGHVGGREEVLEDQGEGELALGRVRLGGRRLDAAENVASAMSPMTNSFVQLFFPTFEIVKDQSLNLWRNVRGHVPYI